MQGSLMPDRLNQVVSSEPSLGTPHAHQYQFITAGSQVVGFTDYDLAAQLPVGTKMVWVWGYWNMAGGVGYIYVENSAGVPGGLSLNPSAAVQGAVSGLVIFNGDRKIRIIVGAFNATAMNFFISPYWI